MYFPEFEIDRQIKLIESGGTVVNETRSYDPLMKSTISMRDKEVLQDYRYMPEPNLPPLRIFDSNDRNCDPNCVYIDLIQHQLQSLPNDVRNNLMEKYGLTLEQAAIIVVSMFSLNLYFIPIVGLLEVLFY